ncbi:MAG: PfkB family carbohydrate kinase [Gemmatimonadota bacterium]|nr:PfkB family carbohydrate kinase [Gemmatimonadota bacterium]
MALHDGKVPYVVVMGGSNIDFRSRLRGPVVMGTSNPAVTAKSAGGVGRNVAENLARMGVRTELITSLGGDANATWLRVETEAGGVGLAHAVVTGEDTGTYNAILDETGDLVVAAASMPSESWLTANAIHARAPLISSAAMLVLDCNISEEAMVHAAGIANAAGIPVLIDPVGVQKAVRLLAVLDAGLHVHTVTPNVAELGALSARHSLGVEPATMQQAVDQLHDRGTQHVWTRLGANGSVFSSRAGEAPHVESLRACPALLVDATGAGDAMLAGYIAGLLCGLGPLAAARWGRAAAGITMESNRAVNPSMNLDALRARAAACDACD